MDEDEIDRLLREIDEREGASRPEDELPDFRAGSAEGCQGVHIQR
jgi:hypothetical protein